MNDKRRGWSCLNEVFLLINLMYSNDKDYHYNSNKPTFIKLLVL